MCARTGAEISTGRNDTNTTMSHAARERRNKCATHVGCAMGEKKPHTLLRATACRMSHGRAGAVAVAVAVAGVAALARWRCGALAVAAKRTVFTLSCCSRGRRAGSAPASSVSYSPVTNRPRKSSTSTTGCGMRCVRSSVRCEGGVGLGWVGLGCVGLDFV